MRAVLGLEDGTFVKGEGLGVEGIVQGELVFTTQYTGYEEALTDPSYKGQILMFTYPLIGNYGVSGETFQSDGMKAEGLVVREACDHPSHHRSTRSIYEFLKDEGKSGIMGIDTRMLTIKTRERGTMKAAIIVGDDDGKEAHTTALELRHGESVKKLDVPGDVFVDDVALRRFIGANAGSQYVVRAGMSKHLVPAIVQLSGEFPTHRHYNLMGWMKLEGRWVYISPQECITAKGKLSEPPSVELDHRLRDYGLQTTGWKESVQAFYAVIKVLPPKLASCLIAFALLPVLQRFFPAAAPRPAVHLVGTSGSGKSEIASLLSSFYGQFNRDTPPAQ